MKALIYVVVFLAFIGIATVSTLYMLNTQQTDTNSAVISATMKNLVMPGPLSGAHQEFEAQCSKCHASFSKTSQKTLCLDCHDDIAKDIGENMGFHGRSSFVKEGQCKSCHTDHEGRDFDIMKLETGHFRHDFTDFELSGAHANPELSCASCHDEGNKFREAPSDCFSCHKDDDEHKGKLGQDCASCHSAESWKETYFDHAETDFPLLGKHQAATCEACHSDEDFENTPHDCLSCHQSDDVHKSPVTQKCDQCHTSDNWKNKGSFDHKRETKFDLIGKHDALLCESCHGDLKFSEKKESGCNDCHGDDDIHKGVNGPRCDQCHGNTDWKTVSFDHNKDTDFKLHGAHGDLGCVDCHKGETSEKTLGSGCYDCHKADDVHSKKLGTSCNDCHNEKGWLDNIAFDHDLSNFPLIGIHAVTDCEECHTTSGFRGTDTACASCHKDDDYHKQSLGNNCAQCHNPNGWSLWQFDHNTQTDFALGGAHEGLSCKECHNAPDSMGKMSATNGCYDCHAGDNIHGSTYGEVVRRCDLCHTSDSFKDGDKKQIRFFHDNPSDAGVDLKDGCADCHEADDIHNGNFGRLCAQCHGVDSFKNIRIKR